MATGTGHIYKDSSISDEARAILGDVTTAGDVNIGNVTNNYGGASEESEEQLWIKCKAALFLTNPKTDRQERISAKGDRVEGTCTWILEDETFKSWMRGDTNFLWISGGPGKGKTMLAIFLTQHLETFDAGPDVYYYFCTAQDKNRMTAESILRGVIYQMLSRNRGMVLYMKQDMESTRQTEFLVKSRDALWGLLVEIVRDDRLREAFCILDGLDECDEDSITWLAEKLLGKDRNVVGRKLRFAVVSRPSTRLRDCPRIRLDPDNDHAIKSDVAIFVESSVSQLQERIQGDAEHWRDVRNRLVKGSSGSFLWVGFIVSDLRNCESKMEIKETLESLPKDLDAIYYRMFARLDDKYKDRFLVLVKWVAMAARPLTYHELAEACNAPGSLDEFCDWIKPCKPLITMHGDDVVLVHQSARDYLWHPRTVDGGGAEKPIIEAAQANTDILRQCLTRIERSVFHKRKLKRWEFINWKKENPLLKYSIFHWTSHAKLLSPKGLALLQSSSLFKESSRARSNWDYLIFGESSLRSMSSLQLACYIGNLQLLESLLVRETKGWRPLTANLTKRSKRIYPIHVAALQGDHAVAGLLLKYGADVAAQDEDEWTALHWAAQTGQLEMGRLLVQHQADVNATNERRETPLHIAVRHGHAEFTEYLLTAGAAINARASRYSETALALGVSTGDECLDAVRDLLKHDANVEHSLHSAAHRGNLGILNGLLEHGMDPNMRTSYNQATPLHWAASCDKKGHQVKVIQLLCRRGADVNAVDEGGRTPLHEMANGFNNEESFVLLLELGANINATDVLGTTPLHLIVVKSGNEELVRLLVGFGADVHATKRSGDTVLHYAVEFWFEGGQNLAVVELILSHTGDYNSVNGSGETPLLKGLRKWKNWREDIYRRQDTPDNVDPCIELLLSAGADINIVDKEGRGMAHDLPRLYRRFRAKLDNGEIVQRRIEVAEAASSTRSST